MMKVLNKDLKVVTIALGFLGHFLPSFRVTEGMAARGHTCDVITCGFEKEKPKILNSIKG
jgi:hypothetical protein